MLKSIALESGPVQKVTSVMTYLRRPVGAVGGEYGWSIVTYLLCDVVQQWLDAGKPIASQVHGECFQL